MLSPRPNSMKNSFWTVLRKIHRKPRPAEFGRATNSAARALSPCGENFYDHNLRGTRNVGRNYRDRCKGYVQNKGNRTTAVNASGSRRVKVTDTVSRSYDFAA